MKSKSVVAIRAFFTGLFFLVCLVLFPSAYASEGESPAEDVIDTPTALSQEETENLSGMLAALDDKRRQIASLEQRIGGSDEVSRPILQFRLAQTWIDLLLDGNGYARVVLDTKDAGSFGTEYWDQAIAELNAHPDIARFAEQELNKHIAMPPTDLSAVDQASAYARLFKLVDAQYGLFRLLFDSVELAQQFDLDVTAQQKILIADLADRAEMNSVLLDLAMNDVTARRAGLQVLPEDGELKAGLAIAQNRVSGLAASLQTAVGMMDELGQNSSAYREQIIAATGEISSDTFSLEVLGNLIAGWSQSLVDIVIEDGPGLLVKFLIFLLIIAVSRKLANIAQKLFEKALDRSEVQLSRLLRTMVLSVVRNLVLIMGIFIALSQIGISLGPVLAGLGVAGFVIGFALQDTLSNFASGMMILVYRPFDTGDVVEAGGVSGTVSHMSLVSTTILTFDNQTIVVPNNMIWGGVIKNVTSQRTRRVDLVFGISYGDDIARAERIFSEIVEADERVLDTPAPTIRLHELADSSVNFIVRPWVKTVDYWAVYWDTIRAVKLRFDEEGISFPFPQRDIHIDTTAALAIEQAVEKSPQPLPEKPSDTGDSSLAAPA